VRLLHPRIVYRIRLIIRIENPVQQRINTALDMQCGLHEPKYNLMLRDTLGISHELQKPNTHTIPASLTEHRPLLGVDVHLPLPIIAEGTQNS